MEVYHKSLIFLLKDKILNNYIKHNYDIYKIEDDIKKYNSIALILSTKIINLDIIKFSINELMTRKNIELSIGRFPIQKYKTLEYTTKVSEDKYKYYDGLDCLLYFKKLKTVNKCMMLVYKDNVSSKGIVTDYVDIWSAMPIYDLELYHEIHDIYRYREFVDGFRCILTFKEDNDNKKEYLFERIISKKYINKTLYLYIYAVYTGKRFLKIDESDIDFKKYSKIKYLRKTSNNYIYMSFNDDNIYINLNGFENFKVYGIVYDKTKIFSDICLYIKNNKCKKKVIYKNIIFIKYNGIGKGSEILTRKVNNKRLLFNISTTSNYPTKLPIKSNIILNTKNKNFSDVVEFFMNQNYNFDIDLVYEFLKVVFEDIIYDSLVKNIRRFFKCLQKSDYDNLKELMNIYFTNTSINNILRQSMVIDKDMLNKTLSVIDNKVVYIDNLKIKKKCDSFEVQFIINIYNVILKYIILRDSIDS